MRGIVLGTDLQAQQILQSPTRHALSTFMEDILWPDTVLGVGGTERSKTWFLPSRSSHSTEGDRHRQSQN